MKEMPKITHRKMVKLHQDPELSAKSIDLVYVNDAEEGIRRMKKGKGFCYVYQDVSLHDKSTLERIRKLAIPPAWNQVWICWLDNGHIQATGFDAKKRKQYRYHPRWNDLRKETKFHSLIEFGKALPALRLKIEKDLSQKELNESKVIATSISLMERTYIRVGNEGYEKMNGSYGLTTLKDKHVEINNDILRFSFKGKKGIFHEVTLKNKKLAKIVKNCRDIPGRELFQYYNETGEAKSIDSGMVNRYIKEVTGGNFTAKDFRTWAGSLSILRSFKGMELAVEEKDKKRNVLTALDEVSVQLGNTRAVCRKYYVHPGIIEKYINDELSKYLQSLDKIEEDDNNSGLTAEEKLLMQILEES
jgi:DNA topoisomerase-1